MKSSIRRAALVAALILASSPAWCAGAFVQAKYTSGTTTSVGVFTSNNTAGNSILVGCAINSGTPTLHSVADTKLNTYTTIKSYLSLAPGGGAKALYYFEADSIASGANTVTATTDSGVVLDCIQAEVSGLAASAFDKDSNGVGTTGTAASSGATATTSFTNEYITGWIFVNGSRTFTAAGSYMRQIQGTGNFSGAYEDLSVTSTGAQTATFTISASTGWMNSVLTFKAASQPAVAGQVGAFLPGP